MNSNSMHGSLTYTKDHVHCLLTSPIDPKFRQELRGAENEVRIQLMNRLYAKHYHPQFLLEALPLSLVELVQKINRSEEPLRVALTSYEAQAQRSVRLSQALHTLNMQYAEAQAHSWLYAQVPDAAYADIRIELLNHVSQYDWVFVGQAGESLVFRRPPRGTRRNG